MDTFADDLLLGAEAIAMFLFGDRKKRRSIYHLHATGQLPLGKMGATLIGRKSTLIKHVAKGERLITAKDTAA
jgi:hypothetical protein